MGYIRDRGTIRSGRWRHEWSHARGSNYAGRASRNPRIEGTMKMSSSRFFLGCSAFLLLFSAGAPAVVYQAESFSAASDTTTGNSGGAGFHNAKVNVDTD